MAGDRVTFLVHAEFDGGAVPDRAQHLRRFGATVAVDWLVVPAEPDDVARARVHATATRGPALGAPPPPTVTGAVQLTDPPEPRLVGLSGFRFAVDPGPFDGRYTRAIGLRPDPGAPPDFEGVRFTFDNGGPVTRAVRVSFDAELTALALPDGATSTPAWRDVRPE
ncbi:MAG: hypothetical protein R3F59_00265 [Myxococcota bacterium]